MATAVLRSPILEGEHVPAYANIRHVSCTHASPKDPCPLASALAYGGPHSQRLIRGACRRVAADGPATDLLCLAAVVGGLNWAGFAWRH
jgi:hypothetical protein